MLFERLFPLAFMGYAMERRHFPPAPAILGLFPGAKVEFNPRVSRLPSQGDPSTQWSRPISIPIIAATVFGLIYPFARNHLREMRRARRHV